MIFSFMYVMYFDHNWTLEAGLEVIKHVFFILGNIILEETIEVIV
jgi:hypothetical protein